jgi:hypothetical protein
MDEKTGGPAFGQVVELRCVRVEMDGSTEWEPEAMVHGGLTVRDYFAAKAMQAFIMNPTPDLLPGCGPHHITDGAYKIADAMLKSRDSHD